MLVISRHRAWILHQGARERKDVSNMNSETASRNLDGSEITWLMPSTLLRRNLIIVAEPRINESAACKFIVTEVPSYQ